LHEKSELAQNKGIITMQERSAILIGATGLIGHHLLLRLLESDAYSAVKVLVRRPFHIKHPKLTVHVVNFQNRSEISEALNGGNALFCCLGTTQKQVKGNQTAYRFVDFHIPVMCAELAAEKGFASFLLVSAVGANTSASNFYLKLKGETEQAIREKGLPSVHIFRPSLLLGKRKELRIGERIAQAVMPVLSPLIPAQYRPIEATKVADAMLKASLQANPGVKVYSYNDMMR
jgi:uncharacterized protein YbjT (DUF2867 family)